MQPITRRLAIKRLLSASALGMPFSGCHSLARPLAAEEISPSERQQMANVATTFMSKFDVPGLSVAIARDGALVYENPFKESPTVSLTNVLRPPQTSSALPASIKPITSTAIFTLIERDKLRQHDKVFGPGAVFGVKFGNPPYKKWVEEITIDHLLTHTCGGWENSSDDPMFENPGMDHAQLIAWTLETKPLKNSPGTHFAYSNFGYCVLKRVIRANHWL